MVDPYGVRGVSLETLRRLLRIDRVEVLLTFMVRDPSRFLMEENYEEPMTALFGGDAWRECADVENRADCLMLRFREVVLNDVVKHATSAIGIRPCDGAASYQVRCKVSDSSQCTSTFSNEATYTVCPADFNCSNTLNVLDIFDFLNTWMAADQRADFDGVNGLQQADVFGFVNAWFTGCGAN